MKKTKCFLIHLSSNMWNDSTTIPWCSGEYFEEKLITQKNIWDEVCDYAAECGFDSLLIDLGDAVKYKSHPEIAVEGAWEVDYLKAELARLRKKGLAVYPKLNFSAGHDAWLGVYSRMLSTPVYYQVVEDLINEVIDIFDTPELFHLGMDEENAINQARLTFACYRQGDLIWHDLKFMFDCVKKRGVRPWIWADYFLDYPEEFKANVPKDVLLSPWYYNHMYSDRQAPLGDDAWSVATRNSFSALPAAGYEILPTASNFVSGYNINHVLRYAREHTPNEKNMGILVSTWYRTNDENKYTLLDAIHRTKYAFEQLNIK